MFTLKTAAKVRPSLSFAICLILLAFSVIGFAQTPGKPANPAPVAETEVYGPPAGMTMQEWNRTAVKDLTTEPQAGRAPKPTAEEKRGICPAGPGVESVQDDPNTLRVYPVQTLVNHATVIQVPGTVSKAWCGDLQGWTLEGESNYVSIKPLAANLSTNLHVLATDGRMYNFRLFSNPAGNYTDVFQVKGAGGYHANVDKLVDDRVADAKKQLEADYNQKFQEAVSQAQLQWVRAYAGKTFFDYAIQEGHSFKIEGVFNDDSFTYFRVHGDEQPIVFLEAKQGYKWLREVINFNVTDGNFYRVQKILEPHQRFVLKLRNEEVTISRKGA
jgi:type IV secretory pathway VirB9-like protein